MSALKTVLRAVATAVLGAICVTLGFASVASGSPTSSRTPIRPTPGYWLVGADGGVFSFDAPFFGSGASQCAESSAPFGGPIFCAAAIASTPDGGGYTILTPFEFSVGPNQQPALASQFGNATGSASCTTHFDASGGPTSVPLDEGFSWVGIASTPSGHGFWLVNQGGEIATCGDASYFGQPGLGTSDVIGIFPYPIGMAATPDGKGYWVADSDGGVFAYGDARYFGSMGNQHLNAPVVGVAATPDGKGYWLVASDGGIFAFGDATFFGSMGGQPLNAPMVGIAANPDGPGYWTAAFDGGVFSFGGAPFEGSMGGQTLNAPVLGITSRAG
jgi:hypothetical protein